MKILGQSRFRSAVWLAFGLWVLFVAGGAAQADPTRGVYLQPIPGKEGGLFGETRLYERSHAVVIGVNRYQRLPRLSGAVRDAQGVKKALTEQGFEVLELLDRQATRQAIAQLLGDRLRNRVGENDRVLIYFAGHGVSTGTGDTAMGYLMPVEGDRESPVSTGISMTELQNWFADYKAKHVMFVADACYSGLALSTRAVGLSYKTREYLRKVTAKPVRVALVAGGAGEEASELRGHGLFTSFFLEAIGGAADADKNGVITSDEVAAYVKPNVAQTAQSQFRAQQNPQMGRRGEGEFIFLNPLADRLMLGSLRVSSSEEGGVIVVNGKDTAVRAPGVVENLKPGTYRVSVRKKDRESVEMEINVQAGAETAMALALPKIVERVVERDRPRPLDQGTLYVRAKRDETGEKLPAQVWVNGVKMGEAHTSYNLDPGVYNVEIRYRDQKPVKKQVRIEPKAGASLNAVFSWEDPEVEETVPGPGMTAMGKAGWSLLGIGAVGIVAGGVLTHFAQQTSEENKDDAKTGFKDDYDAYVGGSITGYVVGGAALTTGIVLLIVDSQRDTSETTAYSLPSVTTDGRGMMAHWQMAW